MLVNWRVLLTVLSNSVRKAAIAKGVRLRDCPAKFRRRRGLAYKDTAMSSAKIPESPMHASTPRRSRRAAWVALGFLMLPALAGCSQESSSSSTPRSGADPVLARVNGVDIRQSDLFVAMEDLGDELKQVPPDVMREHLVSYVADILLVARAAEQKNLQNSDEFKQRHALMRAKLLMGLLLQEHAKTAATEEALQQVYNEQIKPMGATEEVRARHILFRADPKDEKAMNEAEGRAVVDRLLPLIKAFADKRAAA